MQNDFSQHKGKKVQTTVLIPVGGTGERLGLPIPKELLPIKQGKVAIDSTFELLHSIALQVKIIVIINAQKMETVKYLERYTKYFDIAFVFQKNPGFIGAIRSAQSFFEENILLLLPDQIITPCPASPNPLGEAIKKLNHALSCFIVAKEKDPHRFQQDGALTIKMEDNHFIVTRYMEKPSHPPLTLNAVWASIAFKKSIAEQVFLTMENSFNGSLSDKNFQESPFYKAPAILVEKFIDIGTWQAYKNEIIGEQ